MKKKCIVITCLTFVFLLLVAFVLPPQIPINFGFNGKKAEISVYFILLLSPIPALCYWDRNRKNRK